MHYYPEDASPDNIKKLIRTNVCVECGRQLYAYLDEDKKVYLACSNQKHEGIAREYTPPQQDYQTEIRREIELEKEHGRQTSEALATIPKQGQLTQVQASKVLQLVYPNATPDEIMRTAIFCQDFGLHPLANEVYLIPFKGKNVMVVGIPASRKMAHNLKGDFSFLDDTPRAATEEEVAKQYGKDSEEAEANIISVTKLQGVGGNLSIGFGLYPKSEKPYGMDKGNTRRNMANIRSERQAMDRLPGKPMPRYEVIDATYAEVPDIGKVDTTTGEIIQGEVTDIPEIPPEEAEVNSEENIARRIEEVQPPESKSIIDLEWLKESIATLQKKGIKAYSDESLLSYMKSAYKKAEGDTIYEIAEKLNKGMASHLVKVIQDALDKA